MSDDGMRHQVGVPPNGPSQGDSQSTHDYLVWVGQKHVTALRDTGSSVLMNDMDPFSPRGPPHSTVHDRSRIISPSMPVACHVIGV